MSQNIFPIEIWSEISSFLDFNNILNLTHTDKNLFYNLIQNGLSIKKSLMLFKSKKLNRENIELTERVYRFTKLGLIMLKMSKIIFAN